MCWDESEIEMNKEEPVRMDATDWEAIFPGKNFRIGNKILYIRPFEFDDLGMIAAFLSSLGGLEKPADLFSRENLPELAVVVSRDFPELIEKASGLHRDDIRKLPITVAMRLLGVIAEVNIGGYESLEKNLPAVLNQAARIAPLIWLMCSKSSSATGTNGKTSEDTLSEK